MPEDTISGLPISSAGVERNQVVGQDGRRGISPTKSFPYPGDLPLDRRHHVDENCNVEEVLPNKEGGAYLRRRRRMKTGAIVDDMSEHLLPEVVESCVDGDGGGSLELDQEEWNGEDGDNDDQVTFRTSFDLRKASLRISEERYAQETHLGILAQVALPFLVAGMGTVAAGYLLDKVQHWTVFTEVSAIFILVPALLGLKGNLEMTLASRLSTAANLGDMDTIRSFLHLTVGNLILTQLQAIVVGVLASVLACFFARASSLEETLESTHVIVLCLSATVTASLASLALGLLMVIVISIARKVGLNPDNIATPVAASLGDLITLSILSFSSSFFYSKVALYKPYLIAAILSIMGAVPILAIACYFNKCVKPVLLHGWTPIISAMAISSIGGVILDRTVSGFVSFALFSPVINGVGGNLVAVQASRMSTYLHAFCQTGHLPDYDDYRKSGSVARIIGAPFSQKLTPHGKSAVVLLGCVLPGNVAFLALIGFSQQSRLALYPPFIATFLLMSLIQVVVLLWVAHWLVHAIWRGRGDPDNSSIPYLTALGDLLGTALLTLGFHLLAWTHLHVT